MFVKNFRQINKKDESIAGGKGASLGELVFLKIPVPAGFVVLATAFDEFLSINKLDDVIQNELSKIKIEDVKLTENISKKIRNSIQRGKFSFGMEKEILFVFKKTKIFQAAVRSSATSEDSKDLSWAGELETYFNIDEKKLMNSIKKCWSSLFSNRALVYRFENNLENQKISVAVVVQKMIKPESAGICFTVNPVTKNKNELIIEAGWGLGEAVVGGIINPDFYKIEKNNFSILNKNISEQKIMVVGSLTGTKKIKVEKQRQDRQKLADSQIQKLTELCVKIEKHYKYPQDIEWAFSKGKFYILQSRPITTL